MSSIRSSTSAGSPSAASSRRIFTMSPCGVLCVPEWFICGVSLQQGVSFFFVLSGFILTIAYPELPDRRSVARFFVARFARVWPAHVFALCLSALLGLHFAVSHPLVPLANLAMLHAWVPATGWFFSFNAVSWSISTEFFFYAVFPLLICAFRTTWWWKIVIAFALVVGAVVLCGNPAISAFASAPPNAVNRAGILYISPVTRLLEFVLGMATAAFWTAQKQRTASAVDSWIELACIVGCVASLMFFSAKASLAASVGQNWAVYLGHVGTAPMFALMIYVFANQRGIFSRLTARPAMVLLGEISFSVYLLHQLIIRWLVEHRNAWSGIGEPAVYALFWVALLAASWAVWRFVEKPARAAIMRFAPAR